MSQSQNKISFRILVSTDNHLGFKENHHIMGDDSFDAFEEVLQAAKRNNVDFLLLGGDLFHELTPSQSCLYRSMTLFQKYVFGSGDLNFSTKTTKGIYPANYLNENLNIDLPIFIVHGNHDYPSSAGENISTLDLLHASHLINYFGKYQSIDELTIEPILFEKGPVKVALYGMGHIKDTRLHYLFEKDKVKFVDPPSSEYMNILILHQNRFKGIRPGVPYKNCVHTNMLPDFFDLIIWGNEHESIDELVEEPVKNFYIYQPGSTVATSMNNAEALPKHAGFFEIYEKKNFRFVPIKLKNQRPLFVKNIELGEILDERAQKNGKRRILEDDDMEKEKLIAERLEKEVNDFIEENELRVSTQRGLKQPPIVRLRVEYTGFDIIHIKQLESKFLGKVANEGDVLKFWRKTVAHRKTDVKLNEKLNQRFEECLRNKLSFDTIASDSGEIIAGLIEDLIQNSGQARPKVLFNHTFFSQSNGQKFTMQALNNYIEEQKTFAETKLLTLKLTQLQKGSRELMAKQGEYVENRMELTDRYQTDISNLLRDYDLQVNQIPSFLTTKLLEHSDKKSIELLGRIPVKEEAKPDNEDKGNESDNTSSKRKRGRSKSPVKQKKTAANTAVTHLFEEDYEEDEAPRSRSRDKSPVKEPPKQPANKGGQSKAPPQLPKISNGPTGKVSAPLNPPKTNVKVEYEENPQDREFEEMLRSKSYQPANGKSKTVADKKAEPSKTNKKTIDDFLAESNKSRSPSPYKAQEPKREFFKKPDTIKEEPPKKTSEDFRKNVNQNRIEEEPKSKNFQISPNKPTTNSFFKPKGTQDIGTFRSKVMTNYDENYNSNDFYRGYKDKEQEEEEEKDWFEDDFGKLAEIAVSKTRKNAKSSQSTISQNKRVSKEEQEKISKTKKKKREDSPKRSPGLFLDDEEDEFNPLLKKTKKSTATTNKKDKSPDKSPTGRGGGKKNNFFL